MYSKDVNYVGANVDAFQAGNAPDPNLQAVGYRIIPVLAAGATQQDLLNAYASLQVRLTKQTKNFTSGVSEDSFVAGPDWVAAVGMGRLQIIGGLNPTTYRVWIATDCKEMEFVTTPVMNGFAGAGAGSGSSNTASSEDQNFTAAAPTLSSDGVDITGAKAVRLSYKAKNAGATLLAVGKALAYWYSSTLARWIRCPELDYDFAAAGVTAVEPAGTGPAPMPVVANPSITRLQYVANAMNASAGTQVTRALEVQR